MYKGTREVVDLLRKRGFRIDLTYAAWLTRSREIASPEKGPGGAFIWREADVQRLESALQRRGRGPKGGAHE